MSEKLQIGTLSKKQLLKLACEKSVKELNYAAIEDAYNALMDAMEQSLMEGHCVVLQNIGRLVPVVRPAGEGRNPQTNEVVKYGARLSLKFQITTPLKLAMRGLDIKRLGSGESGGQTPSVAKDKPSAVAARNSVSETPTSSRRRR